MKKNKNFPEKYPTLKEFGKSLKNDPAFLILLILMCILIPLLVFFWDGTIPIRIGTLIFLK
jgi:hypothetical protein